MQDLSTTTLAELVARRRKCLAQLRDLGLKQAQLIKDGNVSDLLRLFPAKQQLIAALETLEKQLAPFHRQDPELRVWESPEARAECAAEAEACRQLIQEVMALEQEGERKLTTRRDEVGAQLRSVSAAGRVRQAYQSQSIPSSKAL